ncbi:MAG: branched-chain amino acid ABC transporter permease [Thermoleophilia bacterium]
MSRALAGGAALQRALGLPGSPKTTLERSVGLVVLTVLAAAPLVFNDFWIGTVLTQTFIFGIAASSLIFLSAYGGMISLAQTALMGIAGYIVGNLVTERIPGGETKGLTLGLDPTVALVLAIVITTAIGLIFGAVSARSFGIYFLMLTLTYGVIAYYFFSQVTQFGGFSPIAGINQDKYMPPFIGDVLGHPEKLFYLSLGVALAVYAAIRYVVRTPFGLALQGIRDDPVRMASLGYYVGLHRALAFGFAAFLASLAGVLYVWWQGQIAPGNVYLAATIDLLVMAVIGGLRRIEGAFVGAFAFIVIDTYVRDVKFPGAEVTGQLPFVGGSFNTVIGVIFLLIVVVSPDGLMGIWDRVSRLLFGRGGRAASRPSTETHEPAPRASS